MPEEDGKGLGDRKIPRERRSLISHYPRASVLDILDLRTNPASHPQTGHRDDSGAKFSSLKTKAVVGDKHS